jgi:paraquat-inducible protein B
MAGTPQGPDLPEAPEAQAVPKPRWSLQVIWLIPLVAALIGGWLAVHAILERGPTITVRFKTAEGLEVGKTKLKYKDVDIGLVKTVTLSRDLSQAIATAELSRDFKPHLVDDTRFWVVRPRIAAGTVSGLGTLLGGSYIAVDVGRSTTPRTDFTGLDEPPIVRFDMPGHQYTLHSDNAGSLATGVPVFFRQIPVGQVADYALDPDGKGVTVRVFINQPYTRHVNANTRFWRAGGVKVKLDANGIKVDTQSLVSIVIGGIEFDNPDLSAPSPAVAEPTSFRLFADHDTAMKNPESEVLKMVMVFDESVRGLAVGGPVDFEGIEIGEIAAINLDINRDTGKIKVPVEVNIYPARLRMRSREQFAAFSPSELRAFIDTMVAHGLRAQLRSGNLLTGQRYVALDYFKGQSRARMDWAKTPPELPTIKGNLQEIQNALASVAAKLDRLPLEKIGTDLGQTLETANTLLQRLDTEVAPEARGALADARKALNSVDRALSPNQPLQQDARETLREVGRAAQALRVLADYLERHPESLIHGKKEDQK